MSMITRNKIAFKLKTLTLFEIVFYTGLIILPLVYFPGAKPLPFEIPKVFFVNRWVELLAIITLFNLKYIPKTKNNITIQILLIVFTGIVIITSFLGVDPYKSFMGNYYRGDGIFTLLHLVTLSLIVSLWWKNTWIKNTALSMSFGSIITCLWFFLQLKDVFNPPGATFGNPVFLAGYLSITLPFIALLIKVGVKKYLWIGVVLLQSITIILTSSYGGIITLVIFLLGYVLITNKNLCFKLTSFVVSFITLALIAYYYAKNLAITEKQLIYLPDTRERIFRKATMAINERPVLGWGWANFDYAFEAYTWPMPVTNDIYVDKAHSSFVEIIIATGVIGLATYLIIIIKSGISLYKSKEFLLRYLLLSLVLIVIHSQTNVVSIAEDVILMIIIGIAAKS
jgi:O-antigen ligase